VCVCGGVCLFVCGVCGVCVMFMWCVAYVCVWCVCLVCVCVHCICVLTACVCTVCVCVVCVCVCVCVCVLSGRTPPSSAFLFQLFFPGYSKSFADLP